MSSPAQAQGQAQAHAHAHPSPTSDWLGQIISVLCMVHCMATPLLLAAAPAAMGLVGGWHPVLLVFVVLTSVWAFVPGYRYHRKIEVPLLALGGLSFLTLGALVFEGQLIIETALSICGAGLMLIAHWRNRAYNLICKH